MDFLKFAKENLSYIKKVFFFRIRLTSLP